MKFPSRIAVTVDCSASGKVSENLLAWANVAKADNGQVAVYELVEEFEKTMVPKLRRKGTKNWFYHSSESTSAAATDDGRRPKKHRLRSKA